MCVDSMFKNNYVNYISFCKLAKSFFENDFWYLILLLYTYMLECEQSANKVKRSLLISLWVQLWLWDRLPDLVA